MSPFFFHTADQPLFGLYGPPSSPGRDEAVLLCAPVGREYMITHWCLRALAAELMKAGFHVLRFDYSGHGDSWGSFEQGPVKQWVADVKVAAQELTDNAGVSRLSVVGLRLGATLAYLAAEELSLDHLVLWAPVLDGREHVEQLRCMQAQRKLTWPSAPLCAPGAAFEDLLGHRYSAALIEELAQLSLLTAPLPRAQHVSLVLPAGASGCESLRERLSKHAVPAEVRAGKGPADWDKVEAYAEPVHLADGRRAIVGLLGGVVP